MYRSGHGKRSPGGEINITSAHPSTTSAWLHSFVAPPNAGASKVNPTIIKSIRAVDDWDGGGRGLTCVRGCMFATVFNRIGCWKTEDGSWELGVGSWMFDVGGARS